MRLIKYFYTRGLCLTLFLFGLIICVSDAFLNYLTLSVDCFSSSLTIVGFVLTILIFFQGIARNTVFMENVFKYKKDREFTILCVLSLSFAFVSCIISLISHDIAYRIALGFLILSIAELIGVTISMISIIRYNNKSKKVE